MPDFKLGPLSHITRTHTDIMVRQEKPYRQTELALVDKHEYVVLRRKIATPAGVYMGNLTDPVRNERLQAKRRFCEVGLVCSRMPDIEDPAKFSHEHMVITILPDAVHDALKTNMPDIRFLKKSDLVLETNKKIKELEQERNLLLSGKKVLDFCESVDIVADFIIPLNRRSHEISISQENIQKLVVVLSKALHGLDPYMHDVHEERHKARRELRKRDINPDSRKANKSKENRQYKKRYQEIQENFNAYLHGLQPDIASIIGKPTKLEPYES